MAHRLNVREGQRYAQRHDMKYRPTVWKVGSIRESTVPIPHARLINVDDPLCTKTISCTTLINTTYYEFIGDAPAAV